MATATIEAIYGKLPFEQLCISKTQEVRKRELKTALILGTMLLTSIYVCNKLYQKNKKLIQIIERNNL